MKSTHSIKKCAKFRFSTKIFVFSLQSYKSQKQTSSAQAQAKKKQDPALCNTHYEKVNR